MCTRLNELQEKAKDCDEWKRKYGELQILFKEEEIKHLTELYNSRVSKLSPEVLAMINTETTAKTKTQELYRPGEVTAPQRVSSPSNARNKILDPSDTYLAPQFQTKVEQVAKAAIQEINRARDRSLGRIVSTQRADQSSIGKEKSVNPTEPAGLVPSGAKVRSRVVDIRKDLNARRTFVQVAAEHPRACLNGMAWNSAVIHQPVPRGTQHLIIRDSLVRDLKQILVGGRTTVISFRGASVAQVIKMMELQNEDRVDTLTVMIGTNEVPRNPVTPEAKWESLLICLLNKLKEKYRPRIVVLCTIPHNPEAGSPVADFMNGNITQWNVMIRNLTTGNPNELRLMDVEKTLRMVDHGALTEDGIHFNTQPGKQWINDDANTTAQHSRASTAQDTSRADPTVVMDTRRVSKLLWNRADPCPWGRYKTDMAIKLSMKTLTCRADATRMLNGVDPIVSGLYRIPGVDWLLAEEEQFSSATTLQLADLEGLLGDNTMGPLNTR